MSRSRDLADIIETGQDIKITGGDILTTATTASVFNSTATTVNIAAAASSISLGTSGTSTINLNGINKYSATDALITTITSASPNMNLAISDAFMITVTANTSFTFSNPPASGRAKYISLEIVNGGNFAIIWPANTRWPGGLAPTLTTNGTDIVAFYTDDAGANYRAVLAQKDSK